MQFEIVYIILLYGVRLYCVALCNTAWLMPYEIVTFDVVQFIK